VTVAIAASESNLMPISTLFLYVVTFFLGLLGKKKWPASERL
jgi:hypothetical protein